MTTEFVLDCSLTMTWFFESEVTSATDELLDRLNADGNAVVASHWPLEVGNTLLMSERRKRCTIAESVSFLSILDALSIEIDAESAANANKTTLGLARSQTLTLYDAAYLEIAMRRNLPLATLDKRLRTAAKKVGIKYLPVSI